MIYEVAGLETLSHRLSVMTPQILAKGNIEGWPYLVISHIEGDRIGNIWSELGVDEKLKLSSEMAGITLEIQSCKPNLAIVARNSWPDFITYQWKNLINHHQLRNLDAKWLSKLSDFKNEFILNDFTNKKDVFLHSDLTADHFLVKKDATGNFKISGIIDLADCRVGNPEYDIPATAAYILKNHPQALKSYLQRFGFKNSELNSSLSQKLLLWTCLHQYSHLEKLFGEEMRDLDSGDYKSLAEKIYPL
jgi:hygromycin-B 7''-O-kinase